MPLPHMTYISDIEKTKFKMKKHSREKRGKMHILHFDPAAATHMGDI